MHINETDLPGIGRKYTIPVEDDKELVIIIHDDGKREIYHFEADVEDPISTISFSDAAARQIGSIIEGAFYKPTVTEDKEVCLEGLQIEWTKVGKSSPLAGKSIGELQVRQKMQVAIIAIIPKECKEKEKDAIFTPGPEFVLETGQTVVVTGKHKHVNKFVEELKG